MPVEVEPERGSFRSQTMRIPAPLPLLALLAACSTAPRPTDALGRCIWIDRWDYRTAADVERALDDCAAAGFTAAMFQVRGDGTVAWRSSQEVWSERFGFRDPGFDPLQVAVDAAHRRGMQLHAWVNVMPGWAGVDEPADPRQLLRSRPEWFLSGRDGERQLRRAGKYLTLNPCLPEVREYLAGLCRELAAQYDVDGLHLDYIRFPDGDGDDPDRLGTDPRTLSLFTTGTGRRSDDVEALREWQVQCVTQTVADIAAAVRGTGKRLLLTAAVFADPELALGKVRQDWGSWLRRGLVDAVLPMNYTADDERFAALVQQDVALARGKPVIMGVGSFKHADAAQTVRQLDAALANGSRGVAVFNYRTLFGAGKEGPPPAELRQRVTGWLTDRPVR